MKFKDIAISLNVPDDELLLLGKYLDEIVYSGLAVKERNGVYVSVDSDKYISGVFAKMQKGYGFLRVDDDKNNDIFIPPEKTLYAANGDKVLVEITNKSSGLSDEGRIVQILKRENETIVGKLHVNKNTVFLMPLDRHIGFDVYIKNHKGKKYKNGMIAVAKVTKWPDDKKGAAGEITELLGMFYDKGVDVMSVIKSQGIRCEFSNSCLNEAAEVSKKQIKLDGRKDYREKLIITIDGDDAKDLDDAISLETEGDNFKLGVHIADVSEYVRENSKLDKEALKRGTSVYFADRVVPMLPERISNGCCSLNPNQEKYALSVIMTINKKGEVTSYEIDKSVIISDFRMTYNKVTQILNGDEKLSNEYNKITPMLKDMQELADILNKKRVARGCVNFELPEARFEFDADGKVIDIKNREYTIANSIIEEFMLICNETVAEHVFWNEIPSVYRIHEIPTEEKINRFKIMLSALGYSMKNSKEVYTGMFSEILDKIKGKPEEKPLTTMMLRTLMKARYSPNNDGHFGLAAKYYCHFTSPIRRYPDLLVHRILKESIENVIKDDRYDYLTQMVDKASVMSSEREIAAMEAERAVEDIKKAEYMRMFIGETFTGYISSVTSFGIFVELDNTVEGLIRYSDIDTDYFEFDEKYMRAIGENSNKIYKIGDKVNVEVVSSTPETGEIDFIFA